MKKLDEITIADLMPDSISSDREVSATSRAIDPQLKAVSEGVDLPLILASIDTLTAGVLEHLAAQYDLTAWDSAWPIDTKRAVLKTAIADKRKKGTRGAVQRAIEAVAPLATITEWWEKTPQGTPHTFEIDVLQDGEAVDAETVADVIAQVSDSKPVRSHFTFSVGQKVEGNMYLSGVIRTIAYARVRSSGMTAVQTEIDAGVLAALRGMNIRRIIEFSHMGDMPEPTPPAPALPTVSSESWVNFTARMEDRYKNIAANEQIDVHVGPLFDTVPYDSSLVYAISKIYYNTVIVGHGELQCVDNSGVLAVKNVTSSTIRADGGNYQTCDSTDATVITVYDSSNNPYNAFKYTTNNTDYYYVLDGTQTDWTDDLASIGYHPPAQTLELVVFLCSDAKAGMAVNFLANDYWYAVLSSNEDTQSLIDFGGEFETAPNGNNLITISTNLFYDIIDMYTGNGIGSIPSSDLSNFWCSISGASLPIRLYIRSINAYNNVQTWKVRITKNPNTVSWMAANKSEVFIGYAGSHQLYDASGNAIPYDSTKTYAIVGYYSDERYVSLDDLTILNNQHFSFINYNSSGYLGIQSSDSSTDYLIQRVIYKVE